MIILQRNEQSALYTSHVRNESSFPYASCYLVFRIHTSRTSFVWREQEHESFVLCLYLMHQGYQTDLPPTGIVY